MEKNTLESLISTVLDRHRKETFISIEKHMLEAYEEIASLALLHGPGSYPDKSVNGISARTLKEIIRKEISGTGILPENEFERRKLALEFIRARSLAFEAQRLKYPNYLKPWKPEDDRKLESLWKAGVSERELARIFQRNLGAIRARIEKIQNGSVLSV